MRIGFDLMGSDNAPHNELEALKLLNADAPADLLVVGKGDHEHDITGLGYEFLTADEVVGMHEIPSVAVRQKKNSSLGVLVTLLKEKKIDALVSAGNTGAILGFSMIGLGEISNLSRAGLAITLPTETGYSVMLDVGANLHPKAEDYVNYGIMGAIFSEIVFKKTTPRVAMLNIGSESMKGDELRQRAYQTLKSGKLNFIGNIEGNDIMKGFADVIISDGFTGNVVIKFLEGMIESIWLMLKETAASARRKAMRKKLGQFLVKPAIKNLKARFNYEEHGGGILLGVNGIVIICHGRSSPQALKNAIKLAKTCADFNIIEEIRKRVAP